MKCALLFVDDEPGILSALRRLVRKLDAKVFIAQGGAAGLEVLANNHIDLVVSDMRMPEMDGAQFLARVKELYPDTVRYLLTGYSDIGATINALNDGGIYRYLSKPWDDSELLEVISDGLKIKLLENEKNELVKLTNTQNESLKTLNEELSELNQNLERKVVERTQEIEQTAQMLEVAYEELNGSYSSFIKGFAEFVTNREDLQKGESQLVAELSKEMAQALKLEEATQNDVYHAGLLYQLGKLGLQQNLLNLSEESMDSAQFEEYAKYPAFGEAALSNIRGFDKIAAFTNSQLENFDGTGHPSNVAGAKIKAGARVIRVARDYICLQTGLIKDKPLSAEESFHFIKEHAQKLYDPIVVKALTLFKDKFVVSSLHSNTQKIESLSMQEGMVLAKGIRNSSGLLLISKGSVLTEVVIKKIINIEQKENEKFSIYVERETHENCG